MASSKFPQRSEPDASTSAPSEPVLHQTTSDVEAALTQALPVPDIAFGGILLLVVIMFHAFWVRLITGSFLKRGQAIRALAQVWRADLLFSIMVIGLLAVHLAEVAMWSAALVFGGIEPNWDKAAYFSANCYTTMGEPFSLPHAWRIVPPIIAMSGIFTTAWTASVLVDFVSRYNDLRADIMAGRLKNRAGRKPPP